MDSEIRSNHEKILELQERLKEEGSDILKKIYSSNISTKNGEVNDKWDTEAVGLSRPDKDLEYRTASPNSSEEFYLEGKCDKKVWVVSGSLVLEFYENNSIRELNAGDSVLISKGVKHRMKNIKDEPAEFVTLYESKTK